MKFSKLFMWFALAAGVALPGASTLSAQDWRGVPDRRELRNDHREIVRDRIDLDRLRADIARDQRLLNEAIRRGRSREAARIAAELARDQQALRAQMHELQRDRYEAQYDRRNNGWDSRGNRDPRYGFR